VKRVVAEVVPVSHLLLNLIVKIVKKRKIEKTKINVKRVDPRVVPRVVAVVAAIVPRVALRVAPRVILEVVPRVILEVTLEVVLVATVARLVHLVNIVVLNFVTFTTT